jgi:hypothetical protein
VVFGTASSIFSFVASLPFGVTAPPKDAFSSIVSVDGGGAGVPTRDGSSESSSITNAASNSEGSGPLVPSSTSFGLARLLRAGDSVLEDVDLLVLDAVPAGVAAAFARACSSAILESIAPLSRF